MSNWIIYCEDLILSPLLSKSLPPGVQEKAWGQICPPPPPPGSYKAQRSNRVNMLWQEGMSVSEKDVQPALISMIELICFRHIRLINISSKYSYVQRGVISWNDLMCSRCRQRISEMVPSSTYMLQNQVARMFIIHGTISVKKTHNSRTNFVSFFTDQPNSKNSNIYCRGTTRDSHWYFVTFDTSGNNF